MQKHKATTLSPATIEAFQDFLSARGRSSNTVRAYSADLRQCLIDTERASIPLEDYELTVMRWLTKHKKELAPRTTGRRLTSARAFARWAGWGDEILEDYTTPNPGRVESHPLPGGIEDVRRMLKLARNQEHVYFIALCGLVGLRASEALDVRAEDFRIAERRLTVRGKGDKTRTVPVSEEAWLLLQPAHIRSFFDDIPYVNLKDRQARQCVTSLGHRAGIGRPVASHDLRATFGTAVYNKTGNGRLVQELLGHANLSTTQIYIGVDSNDMKEAVNL